MRSRLPVLFFLFFLGVPLNPFINTCGATSVDDAAEADGKSYHQRILREQKELDELNARIARTKGRIERTRKEEQHVFDELEEIDQRLDLINKEIDLCHMEIRENDDKIIQLRELYKNANITEEKSTVLLGQHLRLLYKERNYGIANFLFSSENLTAFLTRLKFMRLVARQNSDLLNKVRTERESMNEVNPKLRFEKNKDLENGRKLKKKEAELLSEKKKRSYFLARLKKNEKKENRIVEESSANARALQDLIQTLEGKRVLAEKRAKEQKKTVLTFRKTRGHLNWPVSGVLITHFGKQIHPQFKTYLYNQGVEIQASEGVPVHVVGKGTVLYADYLTGYGKMIIVDHGSNFWTLYGHLQEMDVAEGDVVSDATVIGKVGDTGSLDGANLYFQIRKNGTPEDPERWLK